MACRTPKSPQPGHQMGLRSLLKSLGWYSAALVGVHGHRHSSEATDAAGCWSSSSGDCAAARRSRPAGTGWRRCGRATSRPRARPRTSAGAGRAAPGARARRRARPHRGEEVAVDAPRRPGRPARAPAASRRGPPPCARAKASRHTPGDRLPQPTSASGASVVALDVEQVLALPCRGASFRNRFSFIAAWTLAAGGGVAVLVVLDAGALVVAALHAGVADGADAVLGEAEARVVLQLGLGGAAPLLDGEARGVDAGRPSPCAARSPGRTG